MTLGEKIQQKNDEILLGKVEDFEKVVRLGEITLPYNYGKRTVSIYCEVKFTSGKLSISGVEGPFTNGNCAGSWGQIHATIKENLAQITPAPGWSAEKITRFCALWERWHLNDMRSGCEHQRENWDISEELELHGYRWTSEFYARRGKAERAELTVEEYAQFREDSKLVNKLLFRAGKDPKWESPEIAAAMAQGLIYEDVTKRETKAAGWVYPENHPQGLLTKPCEVCGYAYGSAWLREEVPVEVLQELRELPDTDMTPAWV